MRRTDTSGVCFVAALLVMTVGMSGCGMAEKNRRLAVLEEQVNQLKGQLAQAEQSHEAELRRLRDAQARELERLRQEHENAVQQVAEQKTQEADDLVEAQRRLAESLKKELGDAQAKLAMTERGLVLTFLDEIFFDSGKATVKSEAFPVLEKVGTVLRETVPDSPVAVEGHSDNEPIKVSGWKSNWELSSARALAVVHHFVEKENVSPERIRAVGFGEFQPVASNDTPEGRRQNRRVEVVILPKALKKVKE